MRLEGPGPFVTRAVYELDGVEHVWSSRRQRKRVARRPAACRLGLAYALVVDRRPVHGRLSLLRARVRSRLHVARRRRADGITFFVGSIFFTSAAALQYLEVVNTAPA